MEFYNFEVLRGEDVIAVQPSVPLRDIKSAWPKIAKIARSIGLPGCRIRVREQSGAIVILVGAAAAQRYADPSASF
ncbi:MAG: hypothetical protein WBQ45_11370 [Roseiarcus sp.]